MIDLALLEAKAIVAVLGANGWLWLSELVQSLTINEDRHRLASVEKVISHYQALVGQPS